MIQYRDTGDEREGAMSDERAAELNMKIRAFDNQRLFDLVRYCRHQLHEDGLITDDEFGWLIEQGSASARRLEDYDALRAQVSELTRLLAEAEEALRDAADETGGEPEFSDERCSYETIQVGYGWRKEWRESAPVQRALKGASS